jgi:hypothetical protein
MTAAGPVVPKGKGTAAFEVMTKPGEYITLVLLNAHYIPGCDVNIYSGIRHYTLGGYLHRNTIYGAQKQPIGVFNFKESGFFLTLKGIQTPRVHLTKVEPSNNYNYATKQKVVVELPSLSKAKRDEFQVIVDSGLESDESATLETAERHKRRKAAEYKPIEPAIPFKSTV